MAPYPESESMAIKRIKVALRRRNWELFEQGVYKAQQMLETGQKWTSAAQWQELMNSAESEYIPPDLWDRFSDLIRNILKNVDDEVKKNPLPAYEEEPEEIDTFSQADIAIFFNQVLEPVYSSAIKKHRITLNNIMYNNNKYVPEPKWFEDLARLINSLDKPNNDLTGFLSLISTCRKPGIVITSSYDTNIIKNFIKSNIDFSIPDVKIALNPDKNWEFYPLGGTVSNFICSSCGHRAIKTDFASRTIVGSCSRCANPTYPDLVDINCDKPEVNPKIWYQSFNKLTQSTVWILVNPPAYNEQTMIRDLIKDAAQASRVEKVYIVSNRSEIGNWWKNKLEKLIQNAEIRNNYLTLTALLDDFKELTLKLDESEDIQEVELVEENPQELLESDMEIMPEMV